MVSKLSVFWEVLHGKPDLVHFQHCDFSLLDRAECIQPAVHSGMGRWIHLCHFLDCEMEVMKATLSCEDEAEISQGLTRHTRNSRKKCEYFSTLYFSFSAVE